MKNKTLYILWGGLFAVCALLGFFRELVLTGKWLMTAFALAFFVPPGVLLWRARKNGDDHTRLLLRNLSGASLVLTAMLLVANFLSVLAGPWLGTVLHVLLAILSTPMLCGGGWALSIFLWAFLFLASVRKPK